MKTSRDGPFAAGIMVTKSRRVRQMALLQESEGNEREEQENVPELARQSACYELAFCRAFTKQCCVLIWIPLAHVTVATPIHFISFAKEAYCFIAAV